MKIYLRPVTSKDGGIIVKWRNSNVVRNHCFDKRLITEESNLEFYKEFVEKGKYKQFIVERIDDAVGAASYAIATVYLKDMDITNKRCELCIFTSNDEEWNSESQELAINIIINKAFEEYGIHKIYTYVFVDNENEITLMKKCGFKIESLMEKEAIDLSGNYKDVYRLIIINE